MPQPQHPAEAAIFNTQHSKVNPHRVDHRLLIIKVVLVHAKVGPPDSHRSALISEGHSIVIPWPKCIIHVLPKVHKPIARMKRPKGLPSEGRSTITAQRPSQVE